VYYSITGMFCIIFIYIIDLKKFTPKLKKVVWLRCPLIAF
jgi:hypothetical protein